MCRWNLSHKIIRIEYEPKKPIGRRKIYICACVGCDRETRIRSTDYGKRSLCISCAQKKKPFQSIFNSFKSDWRKLKNTITFSQFLLYTKIKECHYCKSFIDWQPYTFIKGKYKHRKYFLDRKDSDLGYIPENVVVCCSKCNKGKSNAYSYNEWLGMTEYFRK